jgi:hypothetical protein
MATKTQITDKKLTQSKSKAAAGTLDSNNALIAQKVAAPPPLQLTIKTENSTAAEDDKGEDSLTSNKDRPFQLKLTDSAAPEDPEKNNVNSLQLETLSVSNNPTDRNYDTPFQFRLTSHPQSITNINSESARAADLNQPIQRTEPETSASTQVQLDIPFGVRNTNICAEAALGLHAFQSNLNRLVSEINDNDDYNADTSTLEDQANQYTAVIRTLAGRDQEVLDGFEVIILQGFINGAKAEYDSIFNGYRSFLVRSANRFARANEIDPMTEELAEAKRQAFESNDTGQLERIQGIVDSVKTYNSRIRDYIQYASAFSNRIRNAETIQRIRSVAGTITEVADKASNALRALNIVANFATDSSNSELHQSINTFQNALDTIDFGLSFVKAVPVFGAIWSNYIYPVSSQCLRLLSSIATIRNRERRLLAWISSNWNASRAPNINGGLSVAFPGGQAVFSFMWNIFMGNYQNSSTAEEYFVDRESQFNAGTNSRLRTERHGFLWLNKRATNLESWATANKGDIWFMLYGADLPFPGHANPEVSINAYNDGPGRY